MIQALVADMASRPDLFQFTTPVDASVVRALLDDCPLDLIDFWLSVGSGVMFESEEVLPPGERYDAAQGRTEYLRGRGLPFGVLVFHEGAWLSAVELSSQSIVSLSAGTFRTRARPRSMTEWYLAIRSEYADRYGLASAVDVPDVGRVKLPGSRRMA